MPLGIQKIPRCEVGGESLVSAAYANKLIDFINGLAEAQIAPIAGVGSFTLSKGSFILNLSALDARVRAVENKVAGLINCISNANISASCNSNTNAITVTLTFPNIPNL